MIQLPTILITAGTSYLGSHCALFFAQHGYQVILLDEQTPSFAHPWAVFIQGNYKDPSLLKTIFETIAIDTIIHIAPATTIYDHALDYYDDFNATVQLLKIMNQHTIKKIIVVSDAMVYGTQEGMVAAEHQKRPHTAAAKSKVLMEHLLMDHAQEYHINYVVIRLFAIAGTIPLYSLPLGNHALLQLIQAMQKNNPIFYHPVHTSDGSPIRDYVHIWDGAYAVLKAYEYMSRHQQSDYFNVGTSRGLSLKQVATHVQQVLKMPVTLIPEKQLPTESPCLIADIGKTIDLLNWQPIYSDINFIIQSTYKAMQR